MSNRPMRRVACGLLASLALAVLTGCYSYSPLGLRGYPEVLSTVPTPSIAPLGGLIPGQRLPAGVVPLGPQGATPNGVIGSGLMPPVLARGSGAVASDASCTAGCSPLLPALAATSVTMALATRFDPRMAAAVVAATWLVVVTLAVSLTDAAAAFGPTMQMLSLFATAAAGVALTRRRRRLDVMSDR